MLNLGNKIGCSRTILYKPKQKLSNKVTESHYQLRKQMGVQVNKVRSLEIEPIGQSHCREQLETAPSSSPFRKPS